PWYTTEEIPLSVSISKTRSVASLKLQNTRVDSLGYLHSKCNNALNLSFDWHCITSVVRTGLCSSAFKKLSLKKSLAAINVGNSSNWVAEVRIILFTLNNSSTIAVMSSSKPSSKDLSNSSNTRAFTEETSKFPSLI